VRRVAGAAQAARARRPLAGPSGLPARRLLAGAAAGTLLGWVAFSQPLAAQASDEAAARGAEQQPGAERGPVVVASKPFAESYVLAEAFAQLLEQHDHRVDRRFGFGSTELVFQALVQGEVHVYPEYTGTGLAAILGETPQGGPDAVFRRVSDQFKARWGLRWLPPLGFENTYAVAMRRSAADSLGIGTLSGLARVAPTLAGGFSPDFVGRADGLPGLADAYRMRFRETRALLQAVKYQALAAGEVDVIDAYSTDGAVARYDLAVMVDDRGFFPPYHAAPLVGSAFYAERPGAVLALSALAGRIGPELMRRANERVELDGAPVAEAAQALLAEAGLAGEAGGRGDGELAGEGAGADQASGSGAVGEAGASADEDTPSPDVATSTGTGGQRAGTRRPIRELSAYMWAGRGELGQQAGRHLLLVLASLGAAVLMAVPTGVLLERRRSLAEAAIRFAGLLQTIPGIALLAFMIPVFGIGSAPAIAALFLYSLLPVLRNTYTGIVGAAPDAVESGRALGMTERQLLGRIRLPLAAPVIMAGVRTAAVINVGTATLAAFVGAGGLGDPIVAGLALSDPVMILSGAVPAAALAMAVDWGLAKAEARVAPRGVRERRDTS